MITISSCLRFALSNRYFSYVMAVSPEGVLEHVYYGCSVAHPLGIKNRHIRTQRECTTHFEGILDYNLSEVPQEYPCFGRSDYRYPAFHGRNSEGNSIFSFEYVSHEVSQDKRAPEGLPAARGGDSETLCVHLKDKQLNITLELYYTVYEHHGVLVRSSKLVNDSDNPVQLNNVFSSAIDFPAGEYDLLHLHGSWSREFNKERLSVPTARFTIESARGTSSAAHNPFIALMEKGTTEDHGRVFASALMYSGNFAISVETGDFGDVRLLTGLNPFGFDWTLGPGESFDTPEALHVYSPEGLSGMSHIWHDFIRDKITPEPFKNAPRKTYLNTWEAAYFDVNEAVVLDLADKAKALGIERLVLDDGWFEGRIDDRRALGDWRADKAKFPLGIDGLAAKVKAKGLDFGLWVEPEMVSPDSQLFRDHPDWALQVRGRKPSLGRNQLTLDLSQVQVADYVFNCVDALLACGDIDYIKWDMNRSMSEAASSALSPEQQSAMPHRYMLGLYDVLTRLTEKYPHVLFENCASGGNRFDLGMLRFMAQGWVSDMCDPVGRLDIIDGASLLFPLETMAAYIGPSPNHQNGRVSSIDSRFAAGAVCASRGVSLSVADIEAHEAALKYWMTWARETKNDMVGGRFYRLRKTNNEVCWQYISPDELTVYLVYFHILSAPTLPFRRVRLKGLMGDREYKLAEDDALYHGDALMASGFTLPYVATGQTHDSVKYMPQGDFSSYVAVFKRQA